jgi:hypothetical protein
MKKGSISNFILLAAVLILAGACKANISRNQDGSFDVETTISQNELQSVITASIADPLIKEISVSFQSGYVLVTGERQRLNDASKTDTLSFRLDLGVSNGQLTSSISNARLDGIAIEQNRVGLWNQTITNRLAILGRKNQNSTLKSLTITPEAITMTWNVAKQ